MHFCRADIAIGGDRNNIFHAGEFAPVSWPEILLLQYVHGDDAIDQVEPFVQVPQSAKAERQRLIFKYGEPTVLEIFARQPIAQMEAPRAILAKGAPWFNPITMRQEIVGENPSVSDETPVEEEPIAAAVELEPAEAPLEYYDAPPEPTRRRR
jgi:hypothetical protein